MEGGAHNSRPQLNIMPKHHKKTANYPYPIYQWRGDNKKKTCLIARLEKGLVETRRVFIPKKHVSRKHISVSSETRHKKMCPWAMWVKNVYHRRVGRHRRLWLLLSWTREKYLDLHCWGVFFWLRACVMRSHHKHFFFLYTRLWWRVRYTRICVCDDFLSQV